ERLDPAEAPGLRPAAADDGPRRTDREGPRALMEVLQQGRAVVYGACEGFWVMILFAPPTKPDMLLARPSLAAMKRRHPSGFPTLTWVLPEAGYRMETDA